MLGDDLEYTEERVEQKQPTLIKKNIPLKLKSINLSSSSSSSICSSTASQPAPSPLSEEQKQRDVATPPILQAVSPMPPIIQPVYEHDRNDKTIQSDHFVSSLNWNMNVNLIGQKLTDHKMDFCMLCCRPILIYGRLLPCQHVMCFECANNNGLSLCLNETCHEKITGIEKVQRGQIFVCGCDNNNDFDFRTELTSSRFQPEMSQKNQCGRSFLNQNELDAHIRSRHEFSK